MSNGLRAYLNTMIGVLHMVTNRAGLAAQRRRCATHAPDDRLSWSTPVWTVLTQVILVVAATIMSKHLVQKHVTLGYEQLHWFILGWVNHSPLASRCYTLTELRYRVGLGCILLSSGPVLRLSIKFRDQE